MSRSKPHEPPMPPSMARVKGDTEKLRTGWTTGACSTAAAKAATIALSAGEILDEVEISLPGKKPRHVTFALRSCERSGDGSCAEAVVVKDAGDDPDVTDGAHMTVRVSWRDEPGLELINGSGVGLVTKPGLGLEVGGPAINSTPREMIRTSIAEVHDVNERGLLVEISVPGGLEMAEKTTNARLGIVGGISILGTTGIVRPFSTAAWAASVVQAINVMSAQDIDTFVLSTGGLTERAAMRLLPDLEEVCFIEVGDFTGQAIRQAVNNGLRRGFFVGMAGKLAKLAAGVMMTHWTRSKVDNTVLSGITREAGGCAATIAEVEGANTARHAYEIWLRDGLVDAPNILCERAAGNLREHVKSEAGREPLELHAIIVDFDTLEPTGASAGALEQTAWRGRS